MTRSTFKTLFYINRSKEKKNGKCPIMGRITIDGEQVLREHLDQYKDDVKR